MRSSREEIWGCLLFSLARGDREIVHIKVLQIAIDSPLLIALLYFYLLEFHLAGAFAGVEG